jgi:nucleoside-diphosphate-sugar epimerase
LWIRHLEAALLEAGVVRRYGSGTSLGDGVVRLEAVRHRKFPIVGSGAGVWSLHIDDAAAATVAALERAPPGIYNIVDDDPGIGYRVAAILPRDAG